MINSINLNANDDDVISVSQLNKMAKSVLENHLPIVWVKGEVSGLKKYAHLYFDLKDDSAKISCVMFAKLAGMVDFEFDNGTKIEVRGRVTLYPQNGSYQINVERMRKVGLGELWEAYNKLIIKLREEGLFEAKYKKPLPIMPKAIGVITSKEGAVIRDVITTLKRRSPHIPIIVYHSAVQGSDSAMQIAQAIRTANQRKDVDVLIVCRGGGSMEDLWSFNEEVVAREVFSSELPIISAIGHETDTTIIDFVSDLRAPTPTAAAELVVKSYADWQHQIDRYKNKLSQNFDYYINNYQQKLDLLKAQLTQHSPSNKLQHQQQLLQLKKENLQKAFGQFIRQKKWQFEVLQNKHSGLLPDISSHQDKLNSAKIRLESSMKMFIENYADKLNEYKRVLNAVSPDKVLQRGYSIIEDSEGVIIQSVAKTKHHAKVNIQFVDGKVSAVIDKKLLPEQTELI
jgi:exodeoxyribonuclease VII large subunit